MCKTFFFNDWWNIRGGWVIQVFDELPILILLDSVVFTNKQ